MPERGAEENQNKKYKPSIFANNSQQGGIQHREEVATVRAISRGTWNV